MKIVYLLGAGASAGSLPIVKNIFSSLVTFRETYISNRSGSSETIAPIKKTINDIEEDFIEGIDFLLKELPRHASIDTLAKKLRITGNADRYNQLKSILSAFFIHAQLIKDVDRRYDSFFASILSTYSTGFIGDVTILTWNYDFQLEKAYSEFSRSRSISTNRSMLNVLFTGSHKNGKNDSFSIFKLNGTAGFNDSSWKEHFTVSDDLNEFDERAFFSEVTRIYAFTRTEGSNIRSSLNFAWDTNEEEFKSALKDRITGSQVLVFVGYSIPFFNREVDREIMQILAPTLTHIYVQDLVPESVIENLTSILPESSNAKIKAISSVDQFYIPPQL